MAKQILTHCPHCGKPLTKFAVFENTADGLDFYREPDVRWQEAATIAAATGIVFAGTGIMAAWYDLPMYLPASAAVLTGLGLPILRLWLNRPAGPPPAPAPNKVVVQVEHVTEDGRHWLLDQLNPKIEWYDLQRVAGTVLDGVSWSRRALGSKAGLSQGDYEKLTQDMLRLNYLESLPNGQNGFRLTGRGRRFLQAVKHTK